MIGNRLLPGTWTGGYRFVDQSGKALQVGFRSTAESVMIDTVRLDASEAQPITGKPEVLLEEWQKKLALKIEAGKIVPLYEVRIAARDGTSRGGSF